MRRLPRRGGSAPDLRWRTAGRLPGGRSWMSVARDGPRTRLWIRGVGAFCLEGDGRRVGGRPDPGVDPALFSRVVLDQVLPRALHLAGIPVLHASAVAGPRGAIVLVGASGSGKSTLAALLAMGGWPLLADDGVRLESRGRRVLVHPTGGTLRLREPVLPLLGGMAERTLPCPGAPRKRSLDARGGVLPVAERAVVLHRLFLLGRSRRLSEARPDARESLLALLAATFRADPWDVAAFARDMRILGIPDLLARVGTLRFPPGRRGLEEALRSILVDDRF